MDNVQFELITKVIALSALAIVALQQILKLKVIPTVFANKYPVPTLIVMSIIATVIATLTTDVVLVSVTDYVAYTGFVAVVSAVVYNNTIKNWAELRALESETPAVTK